MRDNRNDALAAEVARLRAMAESQHRRIAFLEAGGPPAKSLEQAMRSRGSRRDLLRRAGVVAIGAAGAAAAMPRPAAATSGGNVILGQTNLAEAQTTLTYDGTLDAAVTLSVGNNNATADATAIAAAGRGAQADVKLAGTGRLAQLAATGVNSVGPTSTSLLQDTIRGENGEVWVNRPSSVGGWRRVNSFRLDDASNNGRPFTPVRVVNSDAAIGPTVGGFNAPLQSGNTTYQTLIAGLNGIPVTAIGFFGNVTAVAYTSGGFLTLFPYGEARPTVSSLNFSGSFFAWSNFFCVGLGNSNPTTKGRIGIYAGLNSPSDSCHLVIDAFGYIE